MASYKTLLTFIKCKYERGRIIENQLNKLDYFRRKEIQRMLKQGKLFYLSELIPYFKGAKVFMFANGGSVANLKGVERLSDCNLLMVVDGPMHLFRKYGIMPNFWYVHLIPQISMVLEAEKKTPLDFSNTFILVPALDSISAIYFDSYVMKKFRKKHPEATFVLYREVREFVSPDEISDSYLSLGVEPIRLLGGGHIENTFLPLCGFLGIDTLYFCGVDQMDTGHFWDRSRQYQGLRGERLSFPGVEYSLKCAEHAQKLCKEKNIKCFRLERKETVFKNYPLIDFNKAIEEATPRIGPCDIQK